MQHRNIMLTNLSVHLSIYSLSTILICSRA